MVARQIGSIKSAALPVPAAYRKPRKGEFRQPSAGPRRQTSPGQGV